MERFRKIALMYAGPGDRNTLIRAAALAEKNRAKILAVSVLEPIPGVTQILLGRERTEQFFSDRHSELQAELDADLNTLGLGKIPLQIRHGDTAIETIRFVLQERCDLLLKGRDKPKTGATITVTDRKLLRKCPVPLLLLKKVAKRKFTRILAAVDPDPSQQSRLHLHRDVLKLATSLAERENAVLDIIHAWDTFAAATLQGPRFKLTEEEIRELADEERKMRKSWLEDMVAPYDTADLRIEKHLLQGPPSQVILDFAKRRKSDLVVMGSVARSGLPGLLIGNTAEQVLDRLNCSTLTIKPADFHCPVKS